MSARKARGNQGSDNLSHDAASVFRVERRRLAGSFCAGRDQTGWLRMRDPGRGVEGSFSESDDSGSNLIGPAPTGPVKDQVDPPVKK
jgi:hypothetical protein